MLFSKFRLRFPVAARDFLFSKASRPALPPPPPIRWLQRIFSGYSGQGVKLTAHLQLLPRVAYVLTVVTMEYSLIRSGM
jgi:hypothetical protein